MSATQQLVSIDDINESNAPAIYVLGGLKPFLEHTKAEVSGEVPDLTTRKGRERIASLAAKVSKSKTAVEKPGRDYLRRLKEMPKVVEAELREFVTEMDALRDQVRQPLTEWQAAEDARVDRHNDGIAQIKDVNTDGMSASLIGAKIQDLDSTAIGEEWEEFEEEAHRAKAASLATLRTALAKQEQIEAEQAELARHRAEAEARAQQEREAQIARDAEERVRREAEAAAQAEREAAIRREADAKAAAERRELELKLKAEQAERAAAQAEANRIASEQRAEQERVAAAQRQADAVERARLAEIARANAAADEIIRQQNAREADKEHRRTINAAALEAFVKGGMTDECAKQAITLIASRLIPAITIQY
jgi:hypothetical protein